jgi:hypothetical protein
MRTGLWSLLDMINYQVFTLVHVLEIVKQREQMFAARLQMIELGKQTNHIFNDGRTGQPLSDEIGEFEREDAAPILRLLAQIANQLELDAVNDRLERFQTALRITPNLPVHNFYTEWKTLHEAVEDGIRYRYFYYYPLQKAKRLLGVESEWAKVIKVAPYAKAEIQAAVDCYAVGHNTACVFHLMRIAEYGLRALAKERGITSLQKDKPVEWGTWQEVIKATDDAVEEIGKTKPAGPGKDEALNFYGTALGHLTSLKDKRNTVMHARCSFDEGEASSAMLHVREFMEGLAAKIDMQSPQPIPWIWK